jgi:sec-independent protein translocase protein TatB
MFDIGFWEIVLISVIGLVVLGPQRLPIAIRTVLKWVNTAKSMANSVKNEISQELELHEMNENMIKATKQGLKELDPNLKASIDEMKSNVESLTRPYKNNVDDLIKETSPIKSATTDAKLEQPTLNEATTNTTSDQAIVTAKNPTDQTSQQDK